MTNRSVVFGLVLVVVLLVTVAVEEAEAGGDAGCKGEGAACMPGKNHMKCCPGVTYKMKGSSHTFS